MAIDARLKFCLSAARRYLNAERGCLMITHTGHEAMIYDGDEELNLKFPFSRHVVGEDEPKRSGKLSITGPTAGRCHGQYEGARCARRTLRSVARP